MNRKIVTSEWFELVAQHERQGWLSDSDQAKLNLAESIMNALHAAYGFNKRLDQQGVESIVQEATVSAPKRMKWLALSIVYACYLRGRDVQSLLKGTQHE